MGMYMHMNVEKKIKKPKQRKCMDQEKRLVSKNDKIHYRTNNLIQMLRNRDHVDKDLQIDSSIAIGTIVYIKQIERLGKVVGENNSQYYIDLGNNENEWISRENVVPMHSNERRSNETIMSVLENGILSPALRKIRGIKVSSTTEDSSFSNYDQSDDISVNFFVIKNGSFTAGSNLFGNQKTSPYNIALENACVPKMKLPTIEVCRDYLDKNNAITEEQEAYLKSDPNDKDQLILYLYLENLGNNIDDMIKAIFQQRLNYSMLVIAQAIDEDFESEGERRVESIYPSNFKYILLPQNINVDLPLMKKDYEIRKVSCKKQKLEIPANCYFIQNDGKELKYKNNISIDLDVPNYEDEIKNLPDGGYYSHLVRL